MVQATRDVSSPKHRFKEAVDFSHSEALTKHAAPRRTRFTHHPAIRRLLCAARIALGIKRAGAYTNLGQLRLQKRDYLGAIQMYRKAIQADANAHDAYRGIVESANACPAALMTPWGDVSATTTRQPNVPQTDWLNLSFATSPNIAEYQACVDHLIERDPTNLKLFNLASPLFSAGEYAAGYSYVERLRQAQAALARKCGLEHSTTRYLREIWTHNIGHIIGLDLYLKAGLLGWRPPEKTVVLAPATKIANKPYLDLFRPYLHDVITDPDRIQALHAEADCLEVHPDTLQIRDRHICAMQAIPLIQQAWEAAGRKPLLKLSPQAVERGEARLRQLGIPKGAWYVGVHVREPGFHGDAQDQKYRHPDIAHCISAMREIVNRGGWVIRMGNPTMTHLPSMPGVVDYAHHELRCDWMDVFLCATMRFMLGTSSGLTHVPYTFGVPTVSVNWTNMCVPPWFGQDLFIPMLFWSEAKERHLSLDEILRSLASFARNDECLKKLGIRTVENTPEEIQEVVVEMLNRLDGRPAQADSDSLNRRTRALMQPHGVNCVSQLGGSFLKRHPFLLPANDDGSSNPCLK